MVCQAQGRRRRLEESTMHQFPYPLTLDRASYLNHCILHLEDSASKGTLPPIIDTIRVCPMIHQQLDELSMSMICGKHELANHTHTQGISACLISPQLRSQPTRVSPFSFVMFAGNPAGSACSKMSTCPWRAALYMRLASSRASGGMSGAAIFGRFFVRFFQSMLCDNRIQPLLCRFISIGFGRRQSCLGLTKPPAPSRAAGEDDGTLTSVACACMVRLPVLLFPYCECLPSKP